MQTRISTRSVLTSTSRQCSQTVSVDKMTSQLHSRLKPVLANDACPCYFCCICCMLRYSPKLRGAGISVPSHAIQI